MAEHGGHGSTASFGAKALRAIHGRAVFSRRVRVLAAELSALLPRGSKVLDVGCGTGEIAAAILAKRPDIEIQGVDVLLRDRTMIPVVQYDGRTLPFADNSFDCAILVDVLHHTDDPEAVLREVSRVARSVLIKDHYRDGPLAGLRLRFMDWVGNAPHGVRLPYNYLSRREWDRLWRAIGMAPRQTVQDVPLYPAPLSWVFGKGLHFVTMLERPGAASI